MFFGLFGSAKTPLDEFKETFDTLLKTMDSNKKDKTVLENFHSLCDKLNKILISKEKPSREATDFFLQNKIMSILVAYGIHDSPEGVVDIVLKSICSLIKESESKILLTDIHVIESMKSLMHSLDNIIYEDKLRYSTRILLINFLSEICKKFFIYPEILLMMKVKLKEDEDLKTEYEEILVFSILMNVFKTDQLILEYEKKKLIRRAIIICLSFEEVAESSYMENESLLCEILIEKLCNYYEMLPDYFDLSEDLMNITLEVAPNLKRTFPVMVNTYLEFRDYIFFFNKLCNTIRSNKLKEKLRMILFNKFLIKIVQDRLFSSDLKVVRTNLQYLVFILKTIKNSEIVNLIFNFIFGFNDSNSRQALTNKYVSNLINGSNLKEIIENEKNNNTKDSSYYLSESDYDYQNHQSVRIGLCLLRNITNNKEGINIIILTLFEAFFEKCPYMTVHKLILPFTEVCLKQMGDTSYLLENKKSYPNIDSFFSILSITSEDKKFQFSEISENLENNLNRSYSHYINNDIDFYYYYLNQREDQQNYEYIEENYSNDSDDIKNSQKFHFNYFTTNTKLKINSKNKLFDEIAEIEEEFKNIHITFMKAVLEKFVNFINNSYIENLFFTNLIITILTVPCLEFDPVLVLCQSLLLDENPDSNFSFLVHAKTITKEIEAIIKSNPNVLLYIKVRKEDLESNTELIILDKKKKIVKEVPKIKLPASYQQEYNSKLDTVSNIILFTEFLKEFIAIIVHKFHFENLVENLYELYSSMLDSYTN